MKLMSFTSRIGTSLSELKNIWLGGAVTTIPAQYVQPIPTGFTPSYFTGQAGLALSMPGNIVPGRPFSRLLGNQQMTASITPTGFLSKVHFYIGPFRENAVATYRATARAFVFITQKRSF